MAIAQAEDASEQVQYHVLAAELAGQRGEAQIAAEEYVKALRLAPTLELAERATQVAVYADDSELAQEAAKAWVEFEPERFEPRVVLMRMAVRLGQVSDATEQALYLADNHPKGPEQAFRDIAHSLSNEAEHARAALAVMAGLQAEYAGMEEVEYSLGLLALRVEALEVALKASERALEINPEWPDALLLKATALTRLGKIPEAEQLVNNADIDEEEQIELQLAFARLLLEAELAEPAVKQYRRILELNDLHPEALYAMGILEINLGNDDAAYQHFMTLYEDVGLRRDISAYYLGGIEESRGNYVEALDWYEKVSEGDRYLDAAQRKAFVLYKLEQLDEARAWLTQLRESQPELAVQFYLAEGELLYEAREFDDAMALYNKALGEYQNDIDLLYGRSLVAERLGRLTLSERDLRSILEAEPDDARTLNALGYILANHTTRYQEAHGYIARALEQTPDDAAVIDSMGWVKFRLGDLEAALRFLKQAFDKMPDPEVAAHLGEVLWEMGRREDAQKVLEEAMHEDPDHPALRDTIKRLIQ